MAGAGLTGPSAPPSIEGLSDSEIVETMVEWFNENFEDPAQSTPYESAEGGYIYVWGGPYDALEEIGDAFSDVEQKLIEQAVDEVQADGTFDWSPAGHRIKELEDDPEAELGFSPGFEERFEALAGQLDRIEAHIAYWRDRPVGIGHNRPPEESILWPDLNELADAQASVEEVRAELAKNDPAAADPDVLLRAEGRFRRVAKLLKMAAIGMGVIVVEAVTSNLVGRAIDPILDDPAAFYGVLVETAETLAMWASRVPWLL